MAFSEDELTQVVIRDVPNKSTQSFGAKITEDAFFKLIEDERVEKVYYNALIRLIDSPWRSKSLKFL